MPLTPYQLVAPILAFLAIVYAWNLVMRQKKTVWEAILWTLFWGSVGIIALFPSILSYLTAFTGIKDQANAVLVTSIGVIFFLLFYLVMRLEELERRQTKIVREMALHESHAHNPPH